MKLNIVIPLKDELKTFELCLEAIERYLTLPYQVTVIDNNSDLATKLLLSNKAIKNKCIKVVQNKRNLGFPKACNQGIANAPKDVTHHLFLNSDAVITPGSIEKLVKALSPGRSSVLHMDIQIAGPSTCWCAGEQCAIDRSERERFSLEDINLLANKVNKLWEPESYKIGHDVLGFCLLIADKVVKKIGGFNWRAYGIGSAEEAEYRERARRAGFETVWVRNAYVHHFGSMTFYTMLNAQYEEKSRHEKLNSKIFFETKDTCPVYQPVDWEEPVDVLLLSFNRLAYTKRVLNNLLKNTDVPYRLIWIDNGSTDGTQEYMDKKMLLETPNLKEFIVIKNTQNMGLAYAMKQFFEQLQGKYWAKVDNDTILPQGWLGSMIEASEALDLDVIGADHPIRVPGVTNEESKKLWFLSLHSASWDNKDVYFYPLVGGSGIVGRSAFVEGFNYEGPGAVAGWTEWMINHPEARIAFFPEVYAETLDQDRDGFRKEDFPAYNEWILKQRVEPVSQFDYQKRGYRGEV